MTVLANQLGTEVGTRLRERYPQVEVIDATDEPPWTLGERAGVLLTAPRPWLTAPAQRPAGWPGQLRWLHSVAVGMDFYPDWIYDVPQVTCGRGVAAVPIAEYVLAAVLDHEKRLAELTVHDAAPWPLRSAAKPPRLGLLHGKTLGLVGFGAIGREVALRARAFGVRVLALRRSSAPIEDAGVERVETLPALLAASDHLVLALPLTSQTNGLIDAAALAHAKPGLHLINIARGRLLDQKALLDALDAGRLAAATLDVTEPEPLPDGHPLYHHPRVRITPHISWAAGDVLARSAEKFEENLARYLVGEALHDIVDPRRGY